MSTDMESDVDEESFRRAMGTFPSGVTIITSRSRDGAPMGMTASAFSSVSLSPPLCLVCIGNEASCLAAILDSGIFAVCFLAEDQAAISTRFSIASSDVRFDGVRHGRGGATGAPVIEGAIASVECRREAVYGAGDHQILVGRVVGVQVSEDSMPLLYWRGRYGAFAPGA